MIEYIVSFVLGGVVGFGLLVLLSFLYPRSMVLKHRTGKHACNDCENFYASCLQEVEEFKYCPKCGKELTYHTEVLKEMEDQAKNEENSKTEVFEEFNETETKDEEQI